MALSKSEKDEEKQRKENQKPKLRKKENHNWRKRRCVLKNCYKKPEKRIYLVKK